MIKPVEGDVVCIYTDECYLTFGGKQEGNCHTGITSLTSDVSFELIADNGDVISPRYLIEPHEFLNNKRQLLI